MATTSTDTTVSPKKSKLGLILVVLAVLAVLGGGAAAYYYLMPNQHHTEVVVATAEAPIFIALEPFTVNLQSEDHDRYLHIGITLKLADILSQEQTTVYLPEARSRILLLLSNRKAETLITADEKIQLAAEIRTVLNKPLSTTKPSQRITDVLFTTFVVQ
ncbi:flagellar basal body-associated protein FliL [Glaciimonas sp. PAMC28666]|uniref:flagellar basal body-associated protein FliL n=1 Tax=Glaciimonas sp. PAMC28666 TaxID=2807626 RepID=UPI001964BD65|nr:flagellar basal body-associated protein FliL [Glaciimonas sp. PAMC28666]QRX83164.1 flagellar basal body-associated protein FliL [Glaciimonas sp. PAMC28666]